MNQPRIDIHDKRIDLIDQYQELLRFISNPIK